MIIIIHSFKVMFTLQKLPEISENSKEETNFIHITPSKFKDFYFSTISGILKQVRSTQTRELTNDEHKEEANLLLKKFIIHKPIYVITNQRYYLHSITDEQKEWYITNWIPSLVKNCIATFAFIINENLLKQAKIEEAVSNAEKYHNEFLISIRFFSSILKALERNNIIEFVFKLVTP